MMLDYAAELPIPAGLRSPRLNAWLAPVGLDSELRVEVTARFEIDLHGVNREAGHMLMAVVHDPPPNLFGRIREVGDGVVYSSKPDIREVGGLAVFAPSVSGYDYIVASRGDGSFYSYGLAEKVWMAGLVDAMRWWGGAAAHLRRPLTAGVRRRRGRNLH